MIINFQNLKDLIKVYALLNGDILAAQMKCRMSTKYIDDSCLMNNFEFLFVFLPLMANTSLSSGLTDTRVTTYG